MIYNKFLYIFLNIRVVGCYGEMDYFKRYCSDKILIEFCVIFILCIVIDC